MAKSIYDQPHYSYEVRSKNFVSWSVDRRKMENAFKVAEGKAELWKLKNGMPHQLIDIKM